MKTLGHLRIEDPSQVGEARRLALGLCDDLRLGASRGAETAIIVTEMATNLVKHTKGGGDLIFSSISAQGMEGLEILSLSTGAGIAHVDRSLRDGWSTAGTPGTGLGGAACSFCTAMASPRIGTSERTPGFSARTRP